MTWEPLEPNSNEIREEIREVRLLILSLLYGKQDSQGMCCQVTHLFENYLQNDAWTEFRKTPTEGLATFTRPYSDGRTDGWTTVFPTYARLSLFCKERLK